jgi:hypothetical protein
VATNYKFVNGGSRVLLVPGCLFRVARKVKEGI